MFRKISKYLLTFEEIRGIFYLEIFLNTIRKGMEKMSFADTFKALSDPVRREILQLLKNGKLSAGEIGSHFDMTGATISYHLGILKKAGLVWETKVKNYVYYELNTTVVDEILLWLTELKGGNGNDEEI